MLYCSSVAETQAVSPPHRYLEKSIGGGDIMSIELFIAILGLLATVFSIGYMIGKDVNKKK